jgi:hypothetical protein
MQARAVDYFLPENKARQMKLLRNNVSVPAIEKLR